MKAFGRIYLIIVIIIALYMFAHGVNGIYALFYYFIAGILFVFIWLAKEFIKYTHEENVKKRAKEIEKKYPRAYKEFRAKKCIYGNDTESLEKITCRSSKVWEKEENELAEAEEKRRKEHEHWHNEAERIKKLYPEGYKKWEKDNLALDNAIFKAENEIKKLEQQVYIEKWEDEQNTFTKHCRNLRNELLNTFGCYVYDIDLPFDNVETTIKYKVWQMFPYSFCLEEDLDYTDYPTQRENGQLIKAQKKVNIQEKEAQAIAAYINQLSKEENTSVYFCPKEERKDFGFADICYDLNESVNIYWQRMVDALLETEEEWIESVNRRVVIIDVATENDQLIEICKELINKLEKKRPLISFISILKGFSREEMVKLIDKKKKEKLARQKEENRNKAISLCEKYPLAALYYLRNFKGLNEIPDMTDENVAFLLSIPESAYQEQEKKSRAKEEEKLLGSVSSWDTMLGGLKYSYLFYYYPTTCEFEATEDEWENRWLVWDFKNTPNKTSASDHQKALNRIIPMLKEKLVSTFGEDRLKRLTLVCIPASSREKNKARYEEFSNRICGELGMTNAYPHITVVSEKESKHTGGTGLNIGNLSFDEEFFRDKYVLLFDDVITKGNSMKLFKRKMELLGAKVVGGMSLGKTKHERPD